MQVNIPEPLLMAGAVLAMAAVAGLAAGNGLNVRRILGGAAAIGILAGLMAALLMTVPH